MSSYGVYIIKRILISILVVFFISIFVFLIMHLIPGDPVRTMLGEETDEAIIQEYRMKLHLDKPLPEQYVIWASSILHGDFGKSFSLNNADIGEIIAHRFPITISLGIPTLIISTVVGILLGVISATRRGKAVDQIITVAATTMNGIPIFWVGIMFIWIFGLKLHWLPIMGYTSPGEDFGEFVLKAIMPVAILCLGPISAVARQTRTYMLEVINQDFIRTARANGLAERSVKYKHALKNSLIPIVTLLAIQVRWLIGGSVLVEQIFSINGIGRTVLIAIFSRDYTMIQACTLVISLVVIGCNLLLDISYGWLDPRIRVTQRGV
jgi:peptide/nickel transport system permease protein